MRRKKLGLDKHPTLGIIIGSPKDGAEAGEHEEHEDGYKPDEKELRAFDELAEALGVEPKDREAGAMALCAFIDLHVNGHKEPDEDDEEDDEHEFD